MSSTTSPACCLPYPHLRAIVDDPAVGCTTCPAAGGLSGRCGCRSASPTFERSRVPVVEGYGMTETSPVTHVNPIPAVARTARAESPRTSRRPGTANEQPPAERTRHGCPSLDEARIVSLNDPTVEMAVGCRGAAIRGPQVSPLLAGRGETRRVLTTAAAHRDVARMEPDGLFYWSTEEGSDHLRGYNVHPPRWRPCSKSCRGPEVAVVGVPTAPGGRQGVRRHRRRCPAWPGSRRPPTRRPHRDREGGSRPTKCRGRWSFEPSCPEPDRQIARRVLRPKDRRSQAADRAAPSSAADLTCSRRLPAGSGEPHRFRRGMGCGGPGRPGLRSTAIRHRQPQGSPAAMMSGSRRVEGSGDPDPGGRQYDSSSSTSCSTSASSARNVVRRNDEVASTSWRPCASTGC